MRLYYFLRGKFREWNYKRKYGVSIHEALNDYGKYMVLSEEKEKK